MNQKAEHFAGAMYYKHEMKILTYEALHYLTFGNTAHKC